jgi:pSer/pThr/pTyr-binding forkhead associated (FHA) protein
MNTQSINRFLGACGATGPLRLSAERPRVFGPVSVALEKPFALIGSGVNADLRLDDNQVSHRHLYLQVYDGRVFAVDLGSRTGTFWEAGRQAYGWLDRGQSLWIGRHQIRLEEDGPEKEPAAASPNEPLLSRDYIYPGLPPAWSSSRAASTREANGSRPGVVSIESWFFWGEPKAARFV